MIALSALSGLVGTVWIYGALVTSPDVGMFTAIGFGPTVVFVLAHPLGLAAGVLLWRARAFDGATALFVKAATIYFGALCLFAIGGNFLAAALINALYGQA